MLLLLNGILWSLIGTLGSLCTLVQGLKCATLFMTSGSGWAPWETEWKRSSPSAALLSLPDWNFLAVEETPVLETEGHNLGVKSGFERSEAAEVTYIAPCHSRRRGQRCFRVCFVMSTVGTDAPP